MKAYRVPGDPLVYGGRLRRLGRLQPNTAAATAWAATALTSKGGDDRQKQKPFPRIFLSGQGLGGTTQPRGGPSPSVNLSRKSHRSTQRRISVDSDPVMLPSKSEQKGETAGRNSDWDGRLCVLGPCLRTSEHIKQTTCYRERQHQQGLTMGRYVQCVKTPG